MLEKSDQYIHCRVTQLQNNKHFHIAYIYGHNHDAQRHPLWEALHHLSTSIQGAWCLLGDFNAILTKDDRIWGNTVTDQHIQEMSNFVVNCEVQEMPSPDRVFINNVWYEEFDFTLAKLLSHGLSDHTPILIQFQVTPKPPPYFQFCDMWSTHKEFLDIVSTGLPNFRSSNIMRLARDYFASQRRQLRQLNRNSFHNLKSQQESAPNTLLQLQQDLQSSPDNESLKYLENEARNKYISILSSSLALIRQQCKVDWIKYGDKNTRFFHARAKQHKMAMYVYSLQDATGTEVEGFDKEQQVDLCKPFTDKDIKDAMFSIPNHKSPDLDGFSSGYFKASWSITGPLV
ncbi:hypothetical protein Cgig2_007149 [Carnegiea gigantea]|uniref:Endonuclease/exonuclease/phosphatase domain-containing protein n=1 Tax=Carnegiea gigantea TaxID=171969 RepID=A0A9Q1KLM1_9CARY|nr:hypothetical protein Cgig2_007149 [Carnegiea gigantea]